MASLIVLTMLPVFTEPRRGQDQQHCAMGCIHGHFGCHCDQVCSCSRWFDCDDGPSGTGECVCQYGQWHKCGEESPLHSAAYSYGLNNMCVFKVATKKHLNFVDKNTSRSPRKVFAMISHVLPSRTGTSVNMIIHNQKLSNYLYLHNLQDLITCFSGEEVCPGSRPYAHAYHGHQFGNFAGQLGDGRAMTIGHTADGSMEVSLKGAGRTMFSRFGDGKASLYSLCRELLGSVYLNAIGIPVIQSLAVFHKEGSTVFRDEWYTNRAEAIPAGVLVRVGESFLRFGSVQHAAKHVSFDAVVSVCREAIATMAHMETSKQIVRAAKNIYDEKVLDQCFFIHRKYTEHPCMVNYQQLSNKEVLKCLLELITLRSAALVAAWMSVGFAHGVMNTDNISLIGKTIDLNVFGFITRFDPSFTPNFIDTESRYAFGKQRDIMYWNLQRLSDALTGTPFHSDNSFNKDTWMLGSKEWISKVDADEILGKYHKTYQFCYYERMKQRLGLMHSSFDEEAKIRYIDDLVNVLSVDGIDYHYFSRNLADIDLAHIKTQGLRSKLMSLRRSVSNTSLWRQHIYQVVPTYVFQNNMIARLLKPHSFRPEDLKQVLERFYDPFNGKINSKMYPKEDVVQTSCGGQ